MADTGQGAGTAGPHGDDTPTDTPENNTATVPTASDRPARRPQRTKPSKYVQEKRVAFVVACMVAGHTGGAIVQRVAASHAKEADKRRAHEDGLATGTDPEDLPPLLWGMDEHPPSERSVYRLIDDAKQALADRGAAVARIGDRMLGLQLARLDDAYSVARRTKRPAAMVRVVQVTNDLFALNGAIRPQLTALTAGSEPRTGDEPEHEPPPDGKYTEDVAVDLLAELLAKGRERRAAQLLQARDTSN